MIPEVQCASHKMAGAAYHLSDKSQQVRILKDAPAFRKAALTVS
jgi:hypothetical protein